MGAAIDKTKKLLYNVDRNKIIKECYIMAEKNKEMEQKYVKAMLENDLFAVVKMIYLLLYIQKIKVRNPQKKWQK